LEDGVIKMIRESLQDVNSITIEECSELIQALSKLNRWISGDVTLRASKEEIDNMVLEEMVDVYICLEKLNEKLKIIPEDFDSIYISKVTRYNELMNK
jgi:NTP pyrophosphatase (non-canonical NTP hydrolase)